MSQDVILEPLKFRNLEVKEQINGFPCRRISKAEIATIFQQFADAAWRAREAELDGIELHRSTATRLLNF